MGTAKSKNMPIRCASRTRASGAVWLLLATFSVCSGLTWAGEHVFEDGILHVKNGAEPEGGVETLLLEEMWRVGGDEEGIFFGLIAQALVDDDNNVYLLDSQLLQVEVFSAEGEHLRTVGRQGEGPGEFTMAFDMVFMPDGTLGVVQVFPGKLVKLDLEGTPAGVYKPKMGEAVEGGFLALVNCLGAGGNLILSGIDISFDTATLIQTRTYFLKSFGGDELPVADYHETVRVWKFNDNFVYRESENDFIWARLDVAPDGKVVAALPRNEYALTVFNSDGSVDRVIEREYVSWQREERARARANAQIEGQIRQFPPNTPYEIEELEPDIETLFVHDDGTIWVMTSRAMWKSKSGVLKTYDVFSPAGDFIKQVDVIAEGAPANDLLIFARNDLVFQITGFYDAIVAIVGGIGTGAEEEESAPMELVCHRFQ